MITLLSVNVVVTQASDKGLFSPMILTLFVVFFIAGFAFLIYENKADNPLVDFIYSEIKDIVVLQYQTLC